MGIVETTCEAPVITVPTGSSALAASAEIEVQVMEWTAEMLQTTDTK